MNFEDTKLRIPYKEQKKKKEKLKKNEGSLQYQKLKSYILKYQTENPARQVYQRTKTMAKQKNIEFNIDPKDIVIPETCPILGMKLTFERGNGRVPSNVSVNRIDLSKGYVKGNIRIVSDIANRMLSDATDEYLVKFAEWILGPDGPKKD